MKTKTFIAKVVVKGKNVPDFGLGAGVLSETEITFTDKYGWGFDHPSFLQARMEAEEDFITKAVQCIWREKV